MPPINEKIFLAHFSQLEGRFSLSAGDFWVAWWADCQSRSQKEDVWDFRREPLIVFLPKMILFQKSSAGAQLLKSSVNQASRIFGRGTKAIREKMPREGSSSDVKKIFSLCFLALLKASFPLSLVDSRHNTKREKEISLRLGKKILYWFYVEKIKNYVFGTSLWNLYLLEFSIILFQILTKLWHSKHSISFELSCTFLAQR